jgi:hypothetical protein
MGMVDMVTEAMGMVGTGTGATGTVVTTITAVLASTSVPATGTGIRRITADTAAITAIAIAFTHLAAYTWSDLLSPFRQTQQA